ncbi:hypothetical protein DESC_190027 [Desulfosarcina cetonica]|nr:hypothetical protein DESC_190027 [Desulfosarcina cetonica]
MPDWFRSITDAGKYCREHAVKLNSDRDPCDILSAPLKSAPAQKLAPFFRLTWVSAFTAFDLIHYAAPAFIGCLFLKNRRPPSFFLT